MFSSIEYQDGRSWDDVVEMVGGAESLNEMRLSCEESGAWSDDDVGVDGSGESSNDTRSS